MSVELAVLKNGTGIERVVAAPQSVFLSSTSHDLQAYRDAIGARLAGGRFFRCLRHEQSGPADMTAVEFCRAAVQASDIYVGVIGVRRGFEPDGVKSITEMEFDWASERGIPRMVWLSPDRFDGGRQAEGDAIGQRQQAFRERVRLSVIVGMTGFESPAQLALEVENHLLAHFIARELVRSSPGAGGTFVQRQLTDAIERSAAGGIIDLQGTALNPEALDAQGLLERLDRRAYALEIRARQNRAGRAMLHAELAACLRDMAVLASLHEPDVALPLYEKALKFDAGHVPARLGYGDLLRRIGRTKEAEAQYRLAMRNARRKRDASLEAQALHCFALFKQERGHLREARRSLEQLVRFYRKTNDLAALAEVYRTLGVINQHQGDLKQTLEYLDKAESLVAATNREDLFADVYVAKASFYEHAGMPDRQKEYLLKTLAVAQKKHLPYEMMGAYGGLAKHAFDAGDLAACVEYTDEAMELAELHQYAGEVPYLLGVQANVAERRGDVRQAIELGERAIGMLKSMEESYAAAGMMAEVASIFIGLQEYELAEARLREALAAAKHVEVKTPLIRIYKYLGDIELGRQNRRKARRYYRRALAIASEVKIREFIDELSADLKASKGSTWFY